MRPALVIIRTPLQAWIVEKVLKAESIEKYDLLYFTQNNAQEDLNYFNELLKNADNSAYIFVPKRRFDVCNHLEFKWKSRKWFEVKNYGVTLLASIDAFIPNAIANIQACKLITFDDGTGNFNKFGVYHIDKLSRRAKIYRYLFGAVPIAKIKNRIARHYTLYPDFENIVEPNRLRFLNSWSHKLHASTVESNNQETITYFIGEPFEEGLAREQIEKLESHLQTMCIDYYVRHPRERSVLKIGVPNLDKNGLIAEDAILRHAHSQPIHLIGWFSTVLFNLAAIAQRNTMLLLKSDPNSEHMAALARQAGCEIVFI